MVKTYSIILMSILLGGCTQIGALSKAKSLGKIHGLANSFPAIAKVAYAEALYRASLRREMNGDEKGAVASIGDGSWNKMNYERGVNRSVESLQKRIEGKYWNWLGRVPDPEGLQHWSNVVLQSGYIEDADDGILASNEYYNHVGGTSDAYVKSLYLILLYREADPSGLQTFVGALDGGASLQSVITGIRASSEYLDVQVDQNWIYFGLGASPTDEERNQTREALKSGGKYAAQDTLLTSSSFIQLATGGMALPPDIEPPPPPPPAGIPLNGLYSFQSTKSNSTTVIGTVQFVSDGTMHVCFTSVSGIPNYTLIADQPCLDSQYRYYNDGKTKSLKYFSQSTWGGNFFFYAWLHNNFCGLIRTVIQSQLSGGNLTPTGSGSSAGTIGEYLVQTIYGGNFP